MSDFPDSGAPASDFSPPGYDPSVIATVWEYGNSIPGNDPALWRKDPFGAWIHRLDYGQRHSEFGWEICDLGPVRGTTGLGALRPMQWQNYLDQVAAFTRGRFAADGRRGGGRLV